MNNLKLRKAFQICVAIEGNGGLRNKKRKPGRVLLLLSRKHNETHGKTVVVINEVAHVRGGYGVLGRDVGGVKAVCG